MPEISKELANLERIGKLAPEPGTRGEISGLLTSGAERLADARNEGLALSSRFDLAYNAAHAFSLAALRWHGYRSENRYLVFQVLPPYPPAAGDDVAGACQGARGAQRRGVRRAFQRRCDSAAKSDRGRRSGEGSGRGAADIAGKLSHARTR